MELFYSTQIQPPFITLDENETRHCIQALRYKVGDQITITNGCGSHYLATLVTIEKRSCTAQIDQEIKIELPAPELHVGIGITKQSDRWEWMVEKLTELGVHSITPILTHRTEKTKVNSERLLKVMVAALKQSAGANLPILKEPIKWKQLVASLDQTDFLIAHNEGTNIPSIASYLPLQKNTLLLIGPEGGFTSEEVKEAQDLGAKTILLGTLRLRVETAAIAAVAAIRCN